MRSAENMKFGIYTARKIKLEIIKPESQSLKGKKINSRKNLSCIQ